MLQARFDTTSHQESTLQGIKQKHCLVRETVRIFRDTALPS
jgi:hypothetical protein